MVENIKLKISELLGALILLLVKWFDDILDTVKTVVITVIVCLVLTNFFFKPVAVVGSSMYPNLQDGYIGVSSIIGKTVSGIDRFDIVVIEPVKGSDLIVKRVIGLPNETIIFSNNTLIIDGKVIDEYYLDNDYVNSLNTDIFTEDFSYQLQEGEYFCLGDNRIVSLDSRYYGPFRMEQIKSKGILTIYPFSSFGIVK